MTGEGHQWASVFCNIAYANYEQHLPLEERSQFETAILVPLAHGTQAKWSQAIQLILHKWTSMDSSEQQGYGDVVDIVVEQDNHRRRQTLFSKDIVDYLRRIFASNQPADQRISENVVYPN